MVSATPIWVAVVSILAWIALERSGPAAEVPYVDYPAIPNSSSLTGKYDLNTRLRDATEKLLEGRVHFSETVITDASGHVFFTSPKGAILHLVRDASEQDTVKVWARIGGLPLGMGFGPDGRLWVADVARGLLAVDPETRLATLHTSHVQGPDGGVSPILYADDLTVASDGTVFFTDACDLPPSRKVDGEYEALPTFLVSFMSGRPTGRLLRYDPTSRQTTVLIDKMYFANGVALAKDESFVVVAETVQFRILRYWLKGPKAGTHDVLIDKLPGCPDGISAAASGGFWVAISTPAPAAAKFLMQYRWLRAFVARLGKSAQVEPVPWGMVLKISEAGEVLKCLHDPGGERAKFITAVHEHDGKLYLGSLKTPYIPVVDLAKVV